MYDVSGACSAAPVIFVRATSLAGLSGHTRAIPAVTDGYKIIMTSSGQKRSQFVKRDIGLGATLRHNSLMSDNPMLTVDTICALDSRGNDKRVLVASLCVNIAFA